MGLYRCIIVGETGDRAEIIQEAVDERTLLSACGGAGKFLISFEPVSEQALYQGKKHFSHTTVLEFTEVMSALLKADTNIQSALELCASISASKTGRLCQGLLAGINRGDRFHQVLQRYSASFSPLYQALMRLGEKTGSVARVFDRMGRYLRIAKTIRGKLMNALMYPLCVLVVAFLGCIGIICFVLPRMADIFAVFSAGTETAIGIEIGAMYRSIWITLALIVLIAALTVSCWYGHSHSAAFALKLDRFLLFLPFIGSLIRSVETLDFAFAMEMLTGAGITIGNALKEGATVVRNRAYQSAVITVYESILKGEALSAAFLAHTEFPSYIGTWITVGERTGDVGAVFAQIRTFFQQDVEYLSEKLMAIIEPAITIAVGLIILALVIQFVLPVFSLYGTIL
jgi:type II secretory pathway component PulF